MTAPVRCDNCGATMTPHFDGRLYTCAYCRAQVQVAIGADQIARGMALDLANVDAFLARLANTLSQGFAEHSRIEANGSYVMAIEVLLEPDVFMVRREGQHAVAQHKKVVRGIALRTATLPLDRWVELLTESLANHANTNARAAWVLGQIGGRR
jgi:hypothetical protein